MAGRVTPAMRRALALVAQGATISEAARAAQVDLRNLRRAMRREGMPPRRAGRPTRSE